MGWRKVNGHEGSSIGGKTAAEMDKEDLDKRLKKPLHFECALCDEFVFDGPLGEGKAKAAEHRAEYHPELRPSRRKRLPPLVHVVRRPALSHEELEEVKVERRRRAIETGVVLPD